MILCYNEPLALKLAATMEAKGLAQQVHARNFHKCYRQQLVTFGQTLPTQGPNMFDAMVDNVIRAVERKHIPSGQYQAVLIDEGHDVAPEWPKLVTQLVDPTTNSLLLLYDDAQSIYERSRKKTFSLKSLGAQALRRLPTGTRQDHGDDDARKQGARQNCPTICRSWSSPSE